MSDALLAGMNDDVGAEDFDTGHAEMLRAVFGEPFVVGTVGDREVESRQPMLEAVRSSDVEAHGLRKHAVIRRVSDDSQYRVTRIEPDGTGMSVIYLRK